MIDLPNDYINYQQVEELLKFYPVIESLTNSLQLELNIAYIENAEESDSEVIYALVLGNHKLDGMPRPPHIISNKTCNVALIYKQAALKDASVKVKRLTKEILQLNMVLEKIDIAFESLEEDQKRAVEILCRGKKCTPLSILDERRMKRDKRKALENMAIIMRLSVDVYCEVVSKIK